MSWLWLPLMRGYFAAQTLTSCALFAPRLSCRDVRIFGAASLNTYVWTCQRLRKRGARAVGALHQCHPPHASAPALCYGSPASTRPVSSRYTRPDTRTTVSVGPEGSQPPKDGGCSGRLPRASTGEASEDKVALRCCGDASLGAESLVALTRRNTCRAGPAAEGGAPSRYGPSTETPREPTWSGLLPSSVRLWRAPATALMASSLATSIGSALTTMLWGTSGPLCRGRKRSRQEDLPPRVVCTEAQRRSSLRLPTSWAYRTT